jgi:disulfide bond formation protein DsbB
LRRDFFDARPKEGNMIWKATWLSGTSARQIALAVLIAAAFVIVAAWGFEAVGYSPCELCLKERKPYYAAIPLAALVVWLASGRGRPALALAGFVGLMLIFTASSLFGIYHTGVEWGWFSGPTECTGTYTPAEDVNAFLQQLEKAQVVRCDAPALHILGLSLAAWNAIISAGLAGLAVLGARRLPHGSSSVSQ